MSRILLFWYCTEPPQIHFREFNDEAELSTSMHLVISSFNSSLTSTADLLRAAEIPTHSDRLDIERFLDGEVPDDDDE